MRTSNEPSTRTCKKGGRMSGGSWWNDHSETTALFSRLIGDFSLHEFCQQRQRFLPAEVARLGGNGRGDSLLRNVQLRSAEDLLQGDGRYHFAGEVRIIELIVVA